MSGMSTAGRVKSAEQQDDPGLAWPAGPGSPTTRLPAPLPEEEHDRQGDERVEEQVDDEPQVAEGETPR